MPRSSVAPETSTTGRARRVGMLAAVAVAAAAVALVVGPVSAARADTAVGSIAELAAAFATQPSGSTISLGADLTGDAGSDVVKVPAGHALTLDLNGHRLILVSDDEDPVAPAGLGVPAGTSLTIMDSAPGGAVGALDATGSYGDTSPGGGGAGIGGANGEAAGTIIIDGGAITTLGGFDGAGIGGGHLGAGGTTTINGGTVTATGGEFAAGIGGGRARDGGTIAINGGTVIAGTSNGQAAAIGGGYSGSGAALSIGAGAVVTVGSGLGEHGVGPGDIAADSTNFGSLSNAGTLILPPFNNIDIPDGIVVTNSGTIRNGGTLAIAGTLANTGIILNTRVIQNPENVTGHNVTVLLDGNGGTAPTAPDVVYASTFQDAQIGFPADATRAGSTFDGWFTQAVGGAQVTAATDLGIGGPKSLTLYAHWSDPAAAAGDGDNPAAAVGDGGSPATLANTGLDMLPIGFTGALLILIGLALLLRRRRTAH
ncbi:InlB B-repeat-containing protein [Microbacterium sp. STN6]|uniref:InlB B-repeat-containing protein n=1 Tax=Microbacterium sp. STN6 TaxID=2995588 RepID=UPI002260E9D4|nr:InlB B-repeat-containing protein [Microbacterium sp. STN6]MCX7522017.1 InlB B-repeat-containing protein [Microbacterium sp. STN6]